MPRRIHADTTVPQVNQLNVRLEMPARIPSIVATGEELAKEIKLSLADIETGELANEMKSLRGNSWSS